MKLPIKFKDICNVYPPTVSDVISNEDYDKYLRLFTMSQEELEDEFVGKTDKEGNKIPIPTPLQYLFLNVMYNKDFEKIALDGFKFFIKRDVTFLNEANKIIIGNLEQEMARIKTVDDLYIIDEENYFDFQQCIRESVGIPLIEKPDPTMHPKVREMKAKARLRDRVKAKRNAQNGDGNFEDSLVSICCMGIGINPLNIGELSYASVSKLIQRYQYKERYDIDIRSLLAGASSKKVKPKYWMGKIE